MNLHDLFENQQSVNWEIPPTARAGITSGDEIIIWVDLTKLDNSWKKDKGNYVGRGGTENAIKNRYHDFGEWLKKGIPVQMPEVYIRDNEVKFINGRHRFSWMRDHGAHSIPVVLSLNDDDARQKFKWDKEDNPENGRVYDQAEEFRNQIKDFQERFGTKGR